jgi:hypothetical protein
MCPRSGGLSVWYRKRERNISGPRQVDIEICSAKSKHAKYLTRSFERFTVIEDVGTPLTRRPDGEGPTLADVKLDRTR